MRPDLHGPSEYLLDLLLIMMRLNSRAEAVERLEGGEGGVSDSSQACRGLEDSRRRDREIGELSLRYECVVDAKTSKWTCSMNRKDMELKGLLQTCMSYVLVLMRGHTDLKGPVIYHQPLLRACYGQGLYWGLYVCVFIH